MSRATKDMILKFIRSENIRPTLIKETRYYTLCNFLPKGENSFKEINDERVNKRMFYNSFTGKLKIVSEFWS